MSQEKQHWYDLIDWSKGDWTNAHKAQSAYENGENFPVVLTEFKKDCFVNTEDPHTESMLEVSCPSDDEQELTQSEIQTELPSCKVEARTHNESFVGGKRRDDGDSAPLMINRLRQQATPGTSVLNLLNSTNSTCNVNYSHGEYEMSQTTTC
jgi:hypothetical protein